MGQNFAFGLAIYLLSITAEIVSFLLVPWSSMIYLIIIIACNAVSLAVIVSQFMGSVKSARARVDSAQAVLKLFNVFNVPTFLFFYNGKVVDTLIGIVSEENLNNTLKKLSAM